MNGRVPISTVSEILSAVLTRPAVDRGGGGRGGWSILASGRAMYGAITEVRYTRASAGDKQGKKKLVAVADGDRGGYADHAGLSGASRAHG